LRSIRNLSVRNMHGSHIPGQTRVPREMLSGNPMPSDVLHLAASAPKLGSPELTTSTLLVRNLLLGKSNRRISMARRGLSHHNEVKFLERFEVRDCGK